ncbi:hypothetical protein NC652_010874 [Populus alba x Populus x berolinensis]|uniref:Uncharacterized protein n=1 Tax=Populus alba x Populus x berolinensis TaxID=444605 RepID=A0AAD6W6X6_9ROSI|nr:hypothetical protein NC652_010874 [Populus alba x Populus x berolinensis]KAJ7000279.1 hypothetical protein NC653_010913 [Populus alba x Populus x berolinensis]
MTSTKESKFKEILPTKAIHRPSICLTMVTPLNPQSDGASRGQSYQDTIIMAIDCTLSKGMQNELMKSVVHFVKLVDYK